MITPQHFSRSSVYYQELEKLEDNESMKRGGRESNIWSGELTIRGDNICHKLLKNCSAQIIMFNSNGYNAGLEHNSYKILF